MASTQPGRALFITKIDTVEVDSCMEETHELTNTVTDHPVETGFNISDHNRPNPDLLTLHCFVSNTPLSLAQMQSAARAGLDVDDTKVSSTPSRADNAFQRLKAMRDSGQLITVATTLKTYTASSTEGLTISSLSVSRTKDNFGGLEFTIQLKLIRIVTNQSTQSVASTQKKLSTRPKEDQGAPTVEKSTVAKGFDFAFGG